MTVEHLLAWFLGLGGKLHPAVEVAYSDADGHHLRARAELDLSLPIVYCPRAVTLSADDVLTDPCWPQPFKSEFEQSSPEVLVRFLLMKEHGRGSASKWWPYLSTLPKPDQLDTPLWFTHDDKLWLGATNIEAAVPERERLWQGELSAGVALLQDAAVDLAPFTWIMYKWAATILSSRCFPKSVPASSGRDSDALIGQSSPVLCPVLDLANHSPSARVLWIIDDDGYTLSTTDHRPRPGEQIFNNYGAKSNEELLLGYGFTLARNSADAFALSLPPPDSPGRRWAPGAFLALGQTSPVDVVSSYFGKGRPDRERRALDFYLHDRGGVPGPVLDTLGLAVANERELKTMQSAHAREAVSLERMRTQADSQLRTALVQRRKRMQLADARLPIRPSNGRQVHALQYRDSQRNILDTHLLLLSERLSHRARTMRIITLGRILTSAPEPLRANLRAVMRNAAGTRSPLRLKDKGLQDVVFALFICLVWMTFDPAASDTGSDSDASGSSSDSSSTESLRSLLHAWRRLVSSAYCSPPNWFGAGSSLPCRGVNCFCQSGPEMSPMEHRPWQIPVPEEEDAEDKRNADTAYAIVQRASLLGGSNSVFRDERWTKGFLRWALGVWRAEAVVMPASILDQHGRHTREAVPRDRPGDTESAEEEEEEEVERGLFLEADEDADERKTVDAEQPPRKRQKAEDED